MQTGILGRSFDCLAQDALRIFIATKRPIKLSQVCRRRPVSGTQFKSRFVFSFGFRRLSTPDIKATQHGAPLRPVSNEPLSGEELPRSLIQPLAVLTGQLFD